MRTVLVEWTRGISVGGYKFSNLRYADDISLFAANFVEMKELLKKLTVIGLSYSFGKNNIKTNLIMIDRRNLISMDKVRV